MTSQEEFKDLDPFATPERICELARHRRLDRLDRYFRSAQYEGLPDWWTGVGPGKHEPVPLRERAPCVIYPLPKAAVNQATRFTVGEGRFPSIKVEPAKADDALSPEMALSADEADVLTKLASEIQRQLRLKSVSLDLMRRGLSVGTVVPIVQIRDGKFCVDLAHARDCWPEFVGGDPEGEVERLVWCYRYEREVVLPDGSIVNRTFWFRRDITRTHFVAYFEARTPEIPGMPVQWKIDDERSVEHGFGVCPVLWIRNMPAEHSSLDGVSLYQDLDEEFDALNFALSQRHRGVHYFGTPQAYETNVGEEEKPGMTGRTSRAPKEVEVDQYAHQMGARGQSQAKARMLRPDSIWSYRGEAELGVLETSGKAFEVATKHVADVRARILEAIDVVLLDPTTVAGKGEISAKALAIMFAPLLALVDELRESWWERGFERILSLCLRIVATRGRALTERGQRLLLPGIARALPILDRCWLDTPDGRVWIGPRLTPSWGDYFSAGPADVKSAVDAADAAKQAGLIRPETATRYVAPYFGVHDIAAEAEEADGVTPEDAKRKLERMAEEKDAPAAVEETGDDGAEEIRGAAKDADEESAQ